MRSLFPNAQQENLIFYQSLFSHICSHIFPSIIRWRWSIKSSLLYVKFKVMAGTWSDSQALRIVEAWVKYAQRHLEASTVLELREGLKKKSAIFPKICLFVELWISIYSDVFAVKVKIKLSPRLEDCALTLSSTST